MIHLIDRLSEVFGGVFTRYKFALLVLTFRLVCIFVASIEIGALFVSVFGTLGVVLVLLLILLLLILDFVILGLSS